MSQKKCPHCGRWSEWNQNLTDRCEYCGKPLAQEALDRAQKRAEEKSQSEKDWMFYIHPDDSDLLIFFKKAGNLFYTVFMAIISFIMWLIAILPG